MLKQKGFNLISLAILCLFCVFCMGASMDTRQFKWEKVDGRQAIAAADAAFGVTARKWADRPTDKLFSTEEYENFLILRARFSVATATASIEVWQYSEDDDAEPVLTATIASGTQTATKGGYYAQSFIITSNRWDETWKSTDTIGNNEMAKLTGDGCGGRKWFIRVTAISAGTISFDKRAY